MSTRENIDQRRADFVAGAGWAAEWWPPDAASVEAARRFPYPKKPRVVRLSGGCNVRYVRGELEFNHGDGWFLDSNRLTPTDVRDLANLLANPDEDV